MFGPMEIPTDLTHGSLQLKTVYDKKTILYHRRLFDDVAEKRIYSKHNSSIIINPVEPTNTPKSISPYVLIEFDQPVVVGPQSDCTLFLTFPVEIGVFLAGQKKRQLLIDVFTLVDQKYILYGEPNSGIICKYWKSKIYESAPTVSLLMEGVIKLTIKNETTNWNEIIKAVFNAYHMKLFYNNEMIFMKGNMKILDRGVAETKFEKTSGNPDMKQCIEIYSLSKLNIKQTVFIMEYGL